MPAKHETTLNQLNAEAARYAKFCFDPYEQARWRESVGAPESTSYAVVVANRFVPLEAMPASAVVLRRHGRGTNLDTAETRTLRDYWHVVDDALKRLHTSFAKSEPIALIQATAESLPTWPAVGVAASEEDLCSLLQFQFQQIRQKRISWKMADGSTYPTAAGDGMYLLIDWAQHG